MDDHHEEHPQPTTDLEVRCAVTGQFLGRIVDVTTSGMRLITAGELVLEAEYQLVIPAPDACGAFEEVRIEARCMWFGRDVNPELHCAGFEFGHLAPRQQSALARLAETYCLDHQHS